MNNNPLRTHLCILGSIILPPGAQKVKLKPSNQDYIVTHYFTNNIIDNKRKLTFEVSDCTTFTIENPISENKFNSNDLNQLLDDSVAAVSELIIWVKTKDVAGKITPYTRQIGRTDIKVFLVDGANGSIASWINPAFSVNKQAANMANDFLKNMLMENGPAAIPTPVTVSRIMSVMDLLNLGFYTESFITAFSLLDDITQETVKAGLVKKKISSEEQNRLLRSIKEERLKIYLSDLLKLCDWKSLEEDNLKLFKELIKKNKLRNDIMHGNRRINRIESLESVEVILKVINWLRSNQFSYIIPNFPLLIPIKPEFKVY